MRKTRLWAVGLSIALAGGMSVAVVVMYPQHLVYVLLVAFVFDIIAVVAFMKEGQQRRPRR